MAVIKKSALAALAAFLVNVSAHGHVDWLTVDDVTYQGFDSPRFKYEPNHPPVVGWSINAPDNGFVSPSAFDTPDIICHIDATPAPGHVTVKAGDKIQLTWNTWPDSHKGPVLDYLAKCDGECETVDKTSLEFFKIDAGSFIDMSESNGYWATDVLIKDDFKWVVQIPADLAPGNYVLRHEIIALHSAGNLNGAQAYPQCFNLKVTGGGSLEPAGVKGTSLYKETDPGILFNIYTSPIVYPVPGPTLVSGLPSTVAQNTLTATSTGSPTMPGGGSSPSTTSTAGGTGPTAGTTLTTRTTLSTRTTSSTVSTTSSSGGSGGTVAKYGQCGGQGYTGPTTCAAGSTCNVVNPYYSQCL